MNFKFKQLDFNFKFIQLWSIFHVQTIASKTTPSSADACVDDSCLFLFTSSVDPGLDLSKRRVSRNLARLPALRQRLRRQNAASAANPPPSPAPVPPENAAAVGNEDISSAALHLHVFGCIRAFFRLRPFSCVMCDLVLGWRNDTVREFFERWR